ncbi:hypothetical protein [Picosynechococcus sp. PCC 7003]|uniref:hypothetical protein n=1 Tax=Picosynechococcus sp. PCC 7003 TaxID=374981 RepID=UPI001E647859|nr:hypothetical protein [Picosynechococcus sp. PCC 7003]
MSGTLEIEAAHKQKMKDYEQRKKEDEQAIAKLDAMILQTKKETEQLKKENERLAVLESKIDSSFSKHGINLPLAQTPEQP